MHKRKLALGLLSLMPFAGLTGCNFDNLLSPFSSPPVLTGNWQIQSAADLSTSAPPTSGLILLGTLQSNGTSVTGIFRLANLSLPNSCGIPFQQVVTLTGTVDSKGNLALTSAPFGGSVVKVNAVLPPIFSTVASGTVEVTGGACAFPSSPAVALGIASVTGTYGGNVAGSTTVTLPPIPTGAATLTVSQASSANADGQFAVTGNLKFVGGTCTSTMPVSGTISGTQLNLASAAAPPLNVSLDQFFAVEEPQGSQLAAASILFGTGPCHTGVTSLSTYTGTLVKQ